MNFSIKELSTINEYNKLRFILNVLENLRWELLSDNDLSLDEYEKLNVIYLLLEKLFEDKELSESELKNKETSMLFLNRNDILIYLNNSKVLKQTYQNKIEKNLLDKLEKELKSIINKKNNLIESLRIGKNDLTKKDLA